MRESRADCSREPEVLDAVRSGRWPLRCDRDLAAHVNTCTVCAELAVIASAFAAEVDGESRALEPVLPAAGAVWWRAQRRAREEALRRATRPVRVTQFIAVASAAGIVAAVGGLAGDWLSSWVAWFVGLRMPAVLPAGSGFFDLPLPVQAAAVLAALAVGVLAPAAVYLGLADQ